MSSGRKRQGRLTRGAALSRRKRRKRARLSRQERKQRIVRYFDKATRDVQHVPSVDSLYVSPQRNPIADNGGFGQLRIEADLHSGRRVTVEEDITTNKRYADMREVASGLYIQKLVYTVWYGDHREVAFHCDRTHYRAGNPTFPYHRHTGIGEGTSPLEDGDPRSLDEFLLYIRNL